MSETKKTDITELESEKQKDPLLLQYWKKTKERLLGSKNASLLGPPIHEMLPKEKDQISLEEETKKLIKDVEQISVAPEEFNKKFSSNPSNPSNSNNPRKKF